MRCIRPVWRCSWEGLQQLGRADGRNVRIDTRWAASDLSKYAGELIALGPDVIMAFTSAAVPPLQQLTREIPIVFAIAGDPVGAGLVESLARPGGIDEVIVRPLVTKLR
jgi:putative tryptophan/tyrosine transport system substrate-binding protein